MCLQAGRVDVGETAVIGYFQQHPPPVPGNLRLIDYIRWVGWGGVWGSGTVGWGGGGGWGVRHSSKRDGGAGLRQRRTEKWRLNLLIWELTAD
jgi:hypothetical protein